MTATTTQPLDHSLVSLSKPSRSVQVTVVYLLPGGHQVSERKTVWSEGEAREAVGHACAADGRVCECDPGDIAAAAPEIAAREALARLSQPGMTVVLNADGETVTGFMHSPSIVVESRAVLVDPHGDLVRMLQLPGGDLVFLRSTHDAWRMRLTSTDADDWRRAFGRSPFRSWVGAWRSFDGHPNEWALNTDGHPHGWFTMEKMAAADLAELDEASIMASYGSFSLRVNYGALTDAARCLLGEYAEPDAESSAYTY